MSTRLESVKLLKCLGRKYPLESLRAHSYFWKINFACISIFHAMYYVHIAPRNMTGDIHTWELKSTDTLSLRKWNFTFKGKGKMMFLSRCISTERFSKALEGFRITNPIDFEWNLCSHHFQSCYDLLYSQEVKNKKVNPGKILQRDFELTCSKTVLFIVLLRFLTLGKNTNHFRVWNHRRIPWSDTNNCTSDKDSCLFTKKRIITLSV